MFDERLEIAVRVEKTSFCVGRASLAECKAVVNSLLVSISLASVPRSLKYAGIRFAASKCESRDDTLENKNQ